MFRVPSLPQLFCHIHVFRCVSDIFGYLLPLWVFFLFQLSFIRLLVSCVLLQHFLSFGCRAFDLWPPYICKSNMKYLSVQPGFAITDQLPADASTEQKVTWTFLDL